MTEPASRVERTLPLTPGEREHAATVAAAAFTAPQRASGTSSENAATDTGPSEETTSSAAADSALRAAEPKRVSGIPRQGTRTFAAGAAEPRCRHCATRAGGSDEVVQCPDGWCIATLCCCSRPWYTQESPVYATREEANAALASGRYTAPD